MLNGDNVNYLNDNAKKYPPPHNLVKSKELK